MAQASPTPVIRHLVLWLTTSCNLTCAYCYRGHPSAGQSMSEATAMAALELAAQSGQPFHVQLAGGEPTLEPGLIEAVARRVRAQGWPATLAVQTNAVALTAGMAQMFRRWRIGVGVSLDGPLPVQERLRGQATRTLQGMHELEREGVDFGVTAVVCTENLEQLPRLALLLSRFKHARGLGLDLLVRRGRAAAGWPTMADPRALSKAMQKLAHTVAWINQRRKPPLVLRELQRIKSASGAFCQAALGASVAVHPDSRLFPCGQTMDDEDLALGSLHKPDFFKAASLGRFALHSRQCAGCPLDGCCPGECPSRLKYNGPQGQALACAMLRGLAMASGGQARQPRITWEQGHDTV